MRKNEIILTLLIIYGGVAQLGEHLPCKQGVRSSNLLISTTASQDAFEPRKLHIQSKNENIVNQIFKFKFKITISTK